MNAKRRCEICGHFKDFGFTEIGLICESCFKKECAIRNYNDGLEESAKIVEKFKEAAGSYVMDIAKLIRKAKLKEHKPEEHKRST